MMDKREIEKNTMIEEIEWERVPQSQVLDFAKITESMQSTATAWAEHTKVGRHFLLFTTLIASSSFLQLKFGREPINVLLAALVSLSVYALIQALLGHRAMNKFGEHTESQYNILKRIHERFGDHK